MPNKDYVTPTSGSLRLKGIGPSSKISKIHKRKKKRENTGEEKEAIRREATRQDGLRRHDLDVENVDRSKDRNKGQKQAMDGPTNEKSNAAEEDDEDRLGGHKTEAELRYEERRRKRVSKIVIVISRRCLEFGSLLPSPQNPHMVHFL